MFLPDINVWLSLVFESHQHHSAAATWFDTCSKDSCYFCRFTQQGLLRLSTNHSAFGEEALAVDEAWHVYDIFCRDERVSYQEFEAAGLERKWRELTVGRERSSKIWSDAYLAAYALSRGFKLVTFDRGFQKFAPELKLILL